MADLLLSRHILLADDDKDDVLLFQEAFEQLLVPGEVTNVQNGEELLQRLHEKQSLPDILFIDLNMPRINGLECLAAIKMDNTLRAIPVVIFSTSFEAAVIDRLYASGAGYYIRKPSDFIIFKEVIGQALALTAIAPFLQPLRDKFVLSS